MYRAAQEIRKIPKFANVTLGNNLDNDKMLVKEVFTIFIAAKKLPNVQVKIKGEAIEIDGNTYRRNQFHNLPHSLSLKAASIVQTLEEVTFQGHGAPISSLY